MPGIGGCDALARRFPVSSERVRSFYSTGEGTGAGWSEVHRRRSGVVRRSRLIRCGDLGSEIRNERRGVENHLADFPSSPGRSVLFVILAQLIVFLHFSCFIASTPLPRPLLVLQDAVAQLSPLAEWILGSCGLRLIAEIENSLDRSKRCVSARERSVRRDGTMGTHSAKRHVSGPGTQMR